MCTVHVELSPHFNFVTQSGKTGLIADLKVSSNAGFKYLVCCT